MALFMLYLGSNPMSILSMMMTPIHLSSLLKTRVRVPHEREWTRLVNDDQVLEAILQHERQLDGGAAKATFVGWQLHLASGRVNPTLVVELAYRDLFDAGICK